jgi:hypothetical protein
LKALERNGYQTVRLEGSVALMIGLENPVWEQEEQDGPGGRRTRDTKCERERERMMGRLRAKVINHLSNAREVHGPLMADFEMDLSGHTSSYI